MGRRPRSTPALTAPWLLLVVGCGNGDRCSLVCLDVHSSSVGIYDTTMKLGPRGVAVLAIPRCVMRRPRSTPALTAPWLLLVVGCWKGGRCSLVGLDVRSSGVGIYDTSMKLPGANFRLHTPIPYIVILKSNMRHFWPPWAKEDLKRLRGAFKGASSPSQGGFKGPSSFKGAQSACWKGRVELEC